MKIIIAVIKNKIVTMKINNITLLGSKLTFPYVFMVKDTKDKKQISIIADKNNPLKEGDIFYDFNRSLGFRKNNPDGTIHIEGVKVESIESQRKAKGDFSFTKTEPIIQFTTCSVVKFDVPESEISE